MHTCLHITLVQVRESKPVCLTAIGVDAVANAIRAVCHARMYLEVTRAWHVEPCGGVFVNDERGATSRKRVVCNIHVKKQA